MYKTKVYPYKLILLRKKMKLTQEELADKIGISIQKLRNIELGKQVEIKEDTKKLLEKALKCCSYNFVWWEDDDYIDSFFSILEEQRRMIEEFYSSCFDLRWEFDEHTRSPTSKKLEEFTSKSKEFFRVKFDKFVNDIESLERQKLIKKRLGRI